VAVVAVPVAVVAAIVVAVAVPAERRRWRRRRRWRTGLGGRAVRRREAGRLCSPPSESSFVSLTAAGGAGLSARAGQVQFGEYGLNSLDAWLGSQRQSRRPVAMTRHINRGGKV